MTRTILLLIICLFTFNSFSQNPTYQQKLYYSCKVWGFVKYFHSKVSNCEVNWDSVLTHSLPLIKNAITKDDFNNALDTMLEAAGPMDIAITPSPDTLPLELKRNLNFNWISDTIFRQDIRVILDTIKNNFRPHPICWVKDNDGTSSNTGWLVFPHDSLMIDSNLSSNYPNELIRLLLIFKYWNIINYFNPYNYVQDTPWDSTLYNHITEIASDTDYVDFYTSFKKIVANANDAHVEGLTWSNNCDVPKAYIPQIILKYSQNNYVVVKSAYTTTNPKILPGDIIVSVNGKTPAQWEDSLRPYISAGNPSVFRRYMCQYMLGGNLGSSAVVAFKDSLGNNYSRPCNRTYWWSSWFTSYYPNDTLGTAKWKKWDACNIGYVNMLNLQTTDVNAMYNDLKNTTSIIFDIRNYPNGTAWPIANLMFPNSICISKFTTPDVTYPGTFYWYYDYLGVNGNPTPYTGKVIILFNEETQSQAEYSCMILDAMPNHIHVGSQTAGTDGNVTYFKLSQDIHAGYTNLGTYYPNGDSTERIGIVPDSVVYITPLGIRHHRDEVLEKAMQIAGCNVSLSDYSIKSGINIFPNPAMDAINILSPSIRNGEIFIYDIDGRLLLSQLLFQKITKINISNLSEGMYIIKVYSEKGVAIKKFVKE
jgi:carboxyl-terminal processing protease